MALVTFYEQTPESSHSPSLHHVRRGKKACASQGESSHLKATILEP